MSADFRFLATEIDPADADDYMGGGNLDTNGYLEINYAVTTTNWWSCSSWWDPCLDVTPDIYCELAALGECLQPLSISTMDSQDQGGTTDFGTLTLTADKSYLILRPGLDLEWMWPGILPGWLNEIVDDVSGFEAQCNDHDVYYSDCTKTRSQCDTEFKNGMYEECSGDFLCDILLADNFYGAVHDGGEIACLSDRDSCTTAEQDLCSA